MTTPKPTTYAAVMAAFRAMNEACTRLANGVGTEAEYREAFAEYQAAAMAYPGDLIMRTRGERDA